MTIDIEWLVHEEKNQRSDVFYCEGYNHTPVCVVKGENRHILISCDGEMDARFIDSDGEEHKLTDFWDLLDVGIRSDEDLKKYEDKLEWIDNPWFDAYDITVEYEPDLGSDGMGIHLDMVSATLDEILEKVKNYLNEGEYYG